MPPHWVLFYTKSSKISVLNAEGVVNNVKNSEVNNLDFKGNNSSKED